MFIGKGHSIPASKGSLGGAAADAVPPEWLGEPRR